MQKKFAFATIAVAGLATAASAQTRLSHNLEEFLVTAGAGIACAAPSGTAGPQTTTDNFWSRSFTLTDFGVTEGFTVNTVEFGVESLRLPSLIETELTVNLYQVPAGSPPLAGATLVGTASMTSGERALEVVTMDVDGSVDAGSALMVEIESEDFLTLAGQQGDVFFIGGNSFGQDAPSYVASPVGCAIVDPTDVAGLGFPDAHFIIIAEGEAGGGGGCRADLDGDGELTIFDFLTFQNLFDSGDLAADFDGDGSLTIFDFLSFQNEFDAGC
ncbi:MAG: GC-type dockerin domain-anchored protein [Phycisphaerales bacterium JB060]